MKRSLVRFDSTKAFAASTQEQQFAVMVRATPRNEPQKVRLQALKPVKFEILQELTDAEDYFKSMVQNLPTQKSSAGPA